MNQVMNESIMQRKIEIADVTLLENLARMKIDGYSFNAAAKQAIDPKKLWRLKMIQTEFWKKMLTQLWILKVQEIQECIWHLSFNF